MGRPVELGRPPANELNGAFLNDAQLNDANLWGGQLNNAILRRTKLNRADLSMAALKEAYLFEAEMTEANLLKAELSKAVLEGANLSKAALTLAKLDQADLSGSNLKEVDLSHASVAGAHLDGVNLTRAQYAPNSAAPDSYVAQIKGLETLTFPAGQEVGLVQLRDLLQKAGLRDLERQATFAIESGRTGNSIAGWRENHGVPLKASSGKSHSTSQLVTALIPRGPC